MLRPVLISAGLLTACQGHGAEPARVQLAATPQSATSARLLVQVTGTTASAGTWSVQPSQECGGPDGPVQASGPLAWQDGQHASAQVPASRADLITVTVQTSAGILSAADCVQVP